MTTNPTRRPGDIVACACPGCPDTFFVPKRHPYKLYCSKTCGQRAFRIANGRTDARSTSVPKMLKSEWGNIGRIGEPFSGTGSLGQRREYDVANTPADDARFW